MQNKILTTLNQPLKIVFTPFTPETDSLSGLPIGTGNNANDGELGLKVIVIAQRNGPAGITQQPTVLVKTGSYTIPSGASSFSIAFSDDFDGTVGGVTYNALMNPLSVAADNAATLTSFAITRSAGSYLVTQLRVV